jgi:hypothetical protein
MELLKKEPLSLDRSVVGLLRANLKAQEKNLIAIRENRDAIIEMKRVLLDMDDKLRKICLNY